jgi:hypothetical protein
LTKIDTHAIRYTYDLLGHGESEIRLIDPTGKKKVESIFVENKDEFLETCEKYNGKYNIYVGINERDHLGTTAKEVKTVNAIVFDIDAIRPDSKQAASDTELKYCKEIADKIKKSMEKVGYDIHYAFSGNGYQIWIPCPPTTATKQLEECIQTMHRRLQKKWNSGKATIDNIGDLPRIIKVIGTWNIKGDNTPERPHRLSNWETEYKEIKRQQDIIDLAKLHAPGVIEDFVKPESREFSDHEIKTLITINEKISKLYEGRWKEFKNEDGSPKYASASEAEQGLVDSLVYNKLDKEQIFKLMDSCAIGKWQKAAQSYRDLTYKKAIEYIGKSENKNNGDTEKAIPIAKRNEDPDFKNILPENHFITHYMNMAESRTDAHIEYHFACALNALSIAVNRQGHVKVQPTGYYTNLWTIMLGDSTVSRKTTSIKILKMVLALAELDEKKLPEDFSPEGLLSYLSNKPKSAFIRDELGSFFAGLQKAYNAGIPETFCNLYDCPDKYSRVLKKEEIDIYQVYMPFIGATVPKSIAKHSTEHDLDSGFYARMLWLFPTKRKSRKPLMQLTEEDAFIERDLGTCLQMLYKFFVGWKDGIEIHVEDDALERFNEWQENFEDLIQDHENPERIAAFYGRATESAFKLAALFTIGDFNLMFHRFHYFNSYINSLNITRSNKILYQLTQCNGEIGEIGEVCENDKIIIPKKYMDAAIYYIQNLFIPYNIKLVSYVEQYVDADVLERVWEIARRHEKIGRSQLLRYSKLKKKDFDEVIETLIMSNRFDIETKGKATYYIPLKPDKDVMPPKIETPDMSEEFI